MCITTRLNRNLHLFHTLVKKWNIEEPNLPGRLDLPHIDFPSRLDLNGLNRLDLNGLNCLDLVGQPSPLGLVPL